MLILMLLVIHDANMLLVIWDDQKGGKIPPCAKVDKWLKSHLSTFERELLVRRYSPIR